VATTVRSLEADCVAVGPSYGRVLRRFRKKLIVLFETIFGLHRVPGAMQRVALAKRCFAEPGPYRTPASVTAPAQQRTATQVLRAALRPGHAGVFARSSCDEAIQSESGALDCFASLAMTAALPCRRLIPAMRRLDESPIPRRADQYLVHADPRRHAGDEGDGAAEVFGLQHPRLFFFARHHWT
jgi:hypothetical protein